ncbi:unnamed protein product [Linum trigynum]|uniref:Uncharacterized protein n=1 Tax=Linum trigynum TaxID=586398 RepID=A0AAV2GJL9_9ROSI
MLPSLHSHLQLQIPLFDPLSPIRPSFLLAAAMAICYLGESDSNKENLPPNPQLSRSPLCKAKQQRPVRRPLEDISHLFSLSTQLGLDRPRRIPSPSPLAPSAAGKLKCMKRKAGSCVNSVSKKTTVKYKSIVFR